MLFNTPIFVLFLIITFSLYYLPILKKQQILILIIASLTFYSFEKFEFVLLLIASASINTLSSYFVVYGKPKYRKPIAVLGLVLNITILIFFKYSPLISQSLFSSTSSIGQYLLYIPLPIGISFFTFEGISLVVDVWKEKYCKGAQIVSENLLNHAKKTVFFISFFPHLIAGPILKAHDFYPQIQNKQFNKIIWENVVKALILGYFLKMVVADNLKDFTFEISYPMYELRSSTTLLVYIISYACQIFSDFAGYSLIAIGLGRMFGYEFNKNFNYPYISTSFKEFWKRWHMSLSTFLMEYLYIPLGGNRKGKFRTYFNLILTMTIGGLWHGVSWNYALWGVLHGGFLAVERVTGLAKDKNQNIIVLFFRMAFVFMIVSLLWLFFKIQSIEHILGFIAALFKNYNIPNDLHRITYSLVYAAPVFILHAIYLMLRIDKVNVLFRKHEAFYYALLLFFIITNSGTNLEFIYFQF